MRALKLDISLLPIPEAKLIQAYFRLYAHEPDFLWEIAEVPPFDAIMVDAENPASGNTQTDGTQLITLGSATADDCSLQRPLRSDTLVALLRSLQSPTLAPETPALAPVVAPELPAEAAKAPVATGPASVVTPCDYFKLTALPPVALLQRNPQRQQAASLLLRQPMSLQEISLATRWQISEAQTFVGLLRNTGLLEVSDEHPAAAKTGLENASTADPDNKLSLGSAISSFRKKLGL